MTRVGAQLRSTMIDKPKVIGEDTRYRFACDTSHGF